MRCVTDKGAPVQALLACAAHGLAQVAVDAQAVARLVHGPRASFGCGIAFNALRGLRRCRLRPRRRRRHKCLCRRLGGTRLGAAPAGPGHDSEGAAARCAQPRRDAQQLRAASARRKHDKHRRSARRESAVRCAQPLTWRSQKALTLHALFRLALLRAPSSASLLRSRATLLAPAAAAPRGMRALR